MMTSSNEQRCFGNRLQSRRYATERCGFNYKMKTTEDDVLIQDRFFLKIR